jgi:hypothetical protein
MPNNIFNLEAQARYALYVPLLMIIFAGWQSFALVWWMTFFLFFWDEFKVEFLDYEEFYEDCMEMFNLTFIEIPGLYFTHKMINKYYADKQYPEGLIQTADPYDSTSDYAQGQKFRAMDHPEWTVGGDFVLDWINNEWKHHTDVDVNNGCDLEMDDLEQYYLFLQINRPEDVAHNGNKLSLIHRQFHFSGPISLRGPSNQLAAVSAESRNSLEFHQISRRTDDFRYRYWKKNAQRKKKTV